METPWARAKALQKGQEKRFASTPGASPQVNSGRLWFSKRDNRKFNFLVENREIKKSDRYPVKVSELKKLTNDAFFHNSLPAMNIEWPEREENWMLIRLTDFEDLHQRLLEYEAIHESN